MAIHFPTLPIDIAQEIVLLSDLPEAVRIGCASRALKLLLEDDNVWEVLFARDYARADPNWGTFNLEAYNLASAKLKYRKWCVICLNIQLPSLLSSNLAFRYEEVVWSLRALSGVLRGFSLYPEGQRVAALKYITSGALQERVMGPDKDAKVLIETMLNALFLSNWSTARPPDSRMLYSTMFRACISLVRWYRGLDQHKFRPTAWQPNVLNFTHPGDRERFDSRETLFNYSLAAFVAFCVLGGRMNPLRYVAISGPLAALLAVLSPRNVGAWPLVMYTFSSSSRILFWSSPTAGMLWAAISIASTIPMYGKRIPIKILPLFLLGWLMRMNFAESISPSTTALFCVPNLVFILSGALKAPFVAFWLSHILMEYLHIALSCLFTLGPLRDFVSWSLASLSGYLRLSPSWALFAADLYMETPVSELWVHARKAATPGPEVSRSIDKSWSVIGMASCAGLALSGAIVLLEWLFG